MINRQILSRRETDAIELRRCPEHAILQHRVQFKIGLNLVLIQIVTGTPHLFGIKTPVPGLQGKIALLLIDSLLDSRRFTLRTTARGRHDVMHKRQRRLRRFGHLIL